MEPPKIQTNPAGILPANAASGALARVPPGLAAYLPQNLINATVVRLDAEGNPVLRTAAGEVTVRSELPLPPGTNVTLKVLTNTLANAALAPRTGEAPVFTAQLVRVDGQPAPPAPGGQPPQVTVLAAQGQRAAPQGTPASPTSIAPESAAVINATSGAVLRAVVTAPRPEAQAYLPPPPQIGGTQPLAARVQAAYQAPAASPSAPQASAAAPLALKASDVVTVHVLAVKFPPPAAGANTPPSATAQPGNAAVPSAASPAPANPGQVAAPVPQLSHQPAFTATVIGTERSGETVLATPLGTLKLPVGDAPLPKGTELRLEVLTLDARPAAPSTAVPSEDARLMLASGRTALSEIAAYLNQQGPEAREALRQVLPSTQGANQFASRLLWFMGGVASGNAAAFLGPEVLRRLEQDGKGEMVQRLQKDFGRLRQASQDGLGNGWSGTLFPVMDGERLEYGTMFSRKYSDEDAEGRREEGTRFVVDVKMSKLGPMQLDGLFRNEGGEKYFDLFVRSRGELPGEMRKEIHDIFADSVEAAGLHGAIQFQVLRSFPIAPLEAEAAPPENDNLLA